MALADILERIERDGCEEADAIIAEAERRAQALIAEAEAQAVARTIAIREAGQRQAASAAETILGAARLRARDADVAARRAVVERALAEAAEALTSMPDDRYTTFIARGIVDSARGGERVRVAEADRARLAGLPAAVEAAARERGQALELDYADEAADLPHGVVLDSPRMRIEVSPASALEARREEMTMMVSEKVFGGGA